MNILLVDNDKQLVNVVRKVLESKGHRVRAASRPMELTTVLEKVDPEVVVLNLDLPGRWALDQLGRWQEAFVERGEVNRAEMVGTSTRPRGEPAIATELAAMGARAYLRRPYSVLDLGSIVAKWGKGSGALSPTAASPKTVETESTTAFLAKLWCEQATGVVTEQGNEESRCALLRGGPKSAEDWAFLQRLATLGKLDFQSGVEPGQGDWMGLGAFLLASCQENARDGFGKRVGGKALGDGARVDALVMLPIDPGLRDLLVLAAGTGAGRPLEVLARSQSVDLDAMGPVLFALEKMGILQWVSATNFGPWTKPEKGAQKGNDVAESSSSAKETSHTKKSSQSRLKMQKRLRQEWGRLKNAKGPVVLGIPSDSRMSLVDQAVERLTQRYADVADDPGMMNKTQQLARNLLALVEQAGADWAKPEQKAPEPLSTNVAEWDGDQLLELGREFIQRKAWDEAEKVLRRAHDMSIGDASVLANLGWVILHNVKSNQEERLEDARDFLLLAEQFEPFHPEGQLFLARFLLTQNMAEAAMVRALRVKKKRPDAPETSELIDTVQALLDASEND